jgi:hypothetical protein
MTLRLSLIALAALLLFTAMASVSAMVPGTEVRPQVLVPTVGGRSIAG